MKLGPIHYHDTESAQTVHLGAPYHQESTGRTWKYAENGATEADPGKLMCSAATVGANHANLSFATAPAAGDKELKVTLGGTAATADQYRDGFANVQDGTGEGIAYPVGSHKAQTSTTGTLTLPIAHGEEVQVAGALAESNVDLVKNKYKDVVISSTDQADPAVGVFNVTVAIDYFGMLQTWGPAAVWQDTTSAIGDRLTIGSGVAGQVEVDDAAGEPYIGHLGPNTAVATEYQLVYLTIDR